MSTVISLEPKQRKYLIRLLAAEYQEKNDRQLHALAHGSDFYDPDMPTLVDILEKIEPQL